MLTAIALVIVELLSGTFYLLVLAIAAGSAAALAYFGFTFSAQAGFATVLAVAQITAEREKRALIAKSEGQRQEGINLADGEKQAFS
jgi:membrane protein implicated in regulation of membrane protease activity